MNRSGIKRGLAVSAVSALALSGLAVAAQAQTVAQGTPANTLVLWSQSTNGISTATDGENTSVTLFASSSETNAGLPVNAFRFQFEDNGVWTTIGTVNATDPEEVSGGIASIQWTNPPSIAASIDNVRVQSLDINGNPLTTTAPVAVNNEVDHSTHEAVSLAGNNRDEVGIFDGNVIINGKSTDVGNTDVQVVGPTAAGSNDSVDDIGPAVAGVDPWAEVIDVPAGNTPNAVNEIIVRSVIPGESDEVQVYTTYDQVPTNFTVIPDPDNDNPQLPGDQTLDYFLTVTDQKGNPVAGVNIEESVPDGSAPLFPAAGTPDSGTTDEQGRVTVSLSEAFMDFPLGVDQDATAGVLGTYYWADLNNNGSFQNGPDKVAKVALSNIPQAPATVTITSSLGNAMDADERTDLKITVKDSTGAVVPNAGVNVTIDRDGVDEVIAVVTDGNGEAEITAEQIGIDGEAFDAVVTATAGAATGTLTIETDEAVVTWDEYPTAQALATTDTTQGGVVELPSGTVLPNRVIGIDLVTPGANNALFSPQGEQPAGTLRGGDAIASATSNAQGRFSVKVDDPATPNGQELDDILRGSANDAATGFKIDGLVDCPPVVIGLPNCVDLDLDWLRSITPTRVEIHNNIGGTTADGLASAFGGGLRPGGLGIGEVVAFNADNVRLEDVNVNLTIDEGFFVNTEDAFDGTPAVGAPIDFKSAGKTLTVNTGKVVGTGALPFVKGAFVANIERHVGFDDNGFVADEIDATAGAATDEHDFIWSTNNVPINPRATDPLVVALSGDQDSSILPKARAGNVADAIDGGGDGAGSGQVVDYDVNTWDQFGNPTSQVLIVDDSNTLADFQDGPGAANSEHAQDQPALRAFADEATNQSLEVELENAVTTTYFDDVSDSSFDPTDPLDNIQNLPVVVEKNTAAINWYDLDLNASEFSLGQQGSNRVPIGTTVTEVFTAVDQEGQYIGGLTVDFLRAGPGDVDDDSCAEDALNLCPSTNANGKAYLDFAGGSAGVATIDVVVYEDDGTRFGQVASDQVFFGGSPTSVKKKINPSIQGKNVRGGDDVVTVRAKVADGAQVKIYKLVGKNRQVLVKEGVLGKNGALRVRINDTNGSDLTAYKAVVAPTADTRRGVTNRLQQNKAL